MRMVYEAMAGGVRGVTAFRDPGRRFRRVRVYEFRRLTMRVFAYTALVLAVALAVPASAQQDKKKKETALPPDSFYKLQTKSLDGKPADLKEYAGRVTLVVNVASQCGFTKQYTGMEKL